MERSYERWVSLGAHCQPKFQINRHIAFNFLSLPQNTALSAHAFVKLPEQRAGLRKINGGNLFFDWTVVDDYEKVIDLIDSGFDYALKEENLEEYIDKEKGEKIRAIRCRQAGIRWEHLFDRTAELVDWRDQVPRLVQKVEHLTEAFVGLRRYATLYVVLLSKAQVKTDLAGRLYAALRRLRGPSAADFGLLVCVTNLQAEDLAAVDTTVEGIFYRALDPTPDFKAYPWFGSSLSWGEAFADFRLVPTE